MALQNLVSAAINPELNTSIMGKLNGLKTDVSGFVIQILPENKNEYLKVGNIMLPFLDKVYNVARAHPEILPSIFDKEEFFRDYLLTKDLIPMANLLNELNASIQATLFAANSDTMMEGLEVYAAVQQHKDKVPGLETDAMELKEFFKKSPRKPKAEVKP